ncbi:MAG: vitamin B12-dependent ribonucleotide reductase [Parcubacteria group bacterium]|nr:vitamin B12-dependent ribonucleotide reductase [Parcubacteria group bacterium]
MKKVSAVAEKKVVPAVFKQNGGGKKKYADKVSLVKRYFSRAGRHPFDEVKWEKRDIKISGARGTLVDAKNLEFPKFWSHNAASITGAKYFRGSGDKREVSVKQMITRVVKTITGWGEVSGYFNTKNEAKIFEDELTHILLYQKAAFNSPVWFNVGLKEKPQCSACQPHRALISTPAGFYPIGEIVEKKMIGLPVFDSRGITEVVAVKNNGIKTVYKVILRNGGFIEVTGDHLVKAVHRRRTEPEWVRADKLEQGMRLHLHPHQGISDSSVFGEILFNQMNQFRVADSAGSTQVITQAIPIVKMSVSSQKETAEAALAGWLQADGFVGQYQEGTNKSLTIEFLAVAKEEQDWIETHLDVLFPSVHRKIRVTATAKGTPITRIRLYGNVLRPFVEKYQLLNRREKIRVPDMLWRSSPTTIAAYLKSVFQGEGFITIRGQSVKMAVATISKDWMGDLQLLLCGLGIYSRINHKRDDRKDRQDTYELSINVGSERHRFAELVGFISSTKQKKLFDSLLIADQKRIPDLREEEIVGIEKLGEEIVYDIQTSSGEYLTNNIAVHNCFILAVDDNMESIMEWISTEAAIFKGGSGAGVNLSALRSSQETLSNGGYSSGPVSFMRGADAVAGMIKSGGATRRAAKMVLLNIDHPDVMEFIRCKAEEEKKVRALMASGYNMQNLNDPAWVSIQFQNANNSVRLSDEFLKAVEDNKEWQTRFIKTGAVAETYSARELMGEISQAAWECADPGVHYKTTIDRWHTCPNTGPINGCNPCSEYMHLDNSACNLSSINLIHFLNSDGTFKVRDFLQAVDVMILAQEIIVGHSSYPTAKIEKTAHDFRELGLGFTNLSGLLMAKALAYDSEPARAWAGAITALMCGEAYRLSAEISSKMGAYNGYAVNKEPQLRVMGLHRDKVKEINNKVLDDKKLYKSAADVWDQALLLAKKHGVRNSQVTVIAPTGTIALMMDCACTGIEPLFAPLVYKQLVGGGYMKLVADTIPLALKKLNYSPKQSEEIMKWIEDKGVVEGAPGLKEEHLPVFDCAVKPANGTRSIHWQGHVKMVSAVQQFISGAISKTFNMPEETTAAEIQEAYLLGWKLGLKAFAVYRDGCKAAQPLSTKKSKKEETKAQLTLNIGPQQRKLPAIRSSETHKFAIAGHEGFLTYSIYEDNTLAEIFIRIAKQGSTLAGLLDTFAISVSMALQHGVPLKKLCHQFIHGRYEPMGFTENQNIPVASSITDYIFKYLALRFLAGPELIEFGLDSANRIESHMPKLGLPADGSLIIENLPAKEPVLAEAKLAAKKSDSVIYSGTVCKLCGGMMIRTGSCLTCRQCGEANGGC